MMNPTTATITRQAVAAALAEARQKVANDRAWFNALNKAATELEASPWAFDGRTLVINSRTTLGTRYHVAAGSCECKAAAQGRPCWHRAAYRLLVKASELASKPAPRPVRTPEQIARIEAEAAALFV